MIITGGSGDETLTGTPGDDIINGGGGADTMIGLAGNDRYYVDNTGDQVIEAVGSGTDNVYASVDYTLQAGTQVEYLYADTDGGITLTGNIYSHYIYGGGGADHLNGSTGNDIINGEGGADTMAGGLAVRVPDANASARIWLAMAASLGASPGGTAALAPKVEMAVAIWSWAAGDTGADASAVTAWLIV